MAVFSRLFTQQNPNKNIRTFCTVPDRTGLFFFYAASCRFILCILPVPSIVALSPWRCRLCRRLEPAADALAPTALAPRHGDRGAAITGSDQEKDRCRAPTNRCDGSVSETTRSEQALEKKSRIRRLNLLGQDDGLSLFHHWLIALKAPVEANEHLVNVQSLIKPLHKAREGAFPAHGDCLGAEAHVVVFDPKFPIRH